MSEISLLVVIEAGQVRSLVGLAFQIPLPDLLIWGTDALPRVEAIVEESEAWPKDNQLVSAVIIDRDARRIIRAGSSHNFGTPYQLVLFDRLVAAAWQGYDVTQTELTRQALAEAAQIDPPPVDPNLSKQMMGATMGSVMDEDEEDIEHDYDEYYDGEGDDFRQLTTRRVKNDPESMMRQYEDQNWFVSVRTDANEPFRHYLGDHVLQTLIDVGPELVPQMDRLKEIDVPKEHLCSSGILVDAANQKLCLWAHPRGLSWWGELNQDWSGWNVQHWTTNGYRRQLEATGEADRIVIPTDLQVLSGFVPGLAEHLDFGEMMGQLKSSLRGFVRKGFGCLAFVLAIPALIAWAVSGSWKGPFAFAGTIWVLALIAYLVIAHKMKRGFAGIGEHQKRAAEMLPKLAPEDKDERVRIIDAALKTAGLPSFQQIEACAEQYNEFHDGEFADGEYDDEIDDDPIGPIVSG